MNYRPVTDLRVKRLREEIIRWRALALIATGLAVYFAACLMYERAFQ